jgi:hypothetical protein
MKLNQGLFTVFKGENVTIKITPSQSLGAGQAVASRDGGVEPALVFTVTKNVGQEHFVDVVYGFEGASTGNYRIVINGDAAGNEGPFVRNINNNSPVQPTPKRTYTFHVVSKPQ